MSPRLDTGLAKPFVRRKSFSLSFCELAIAYHAEQEGRSLFDCDGRAACCVAAVALEAVVSAATGGPCTVGMPMEVPWTWMLPALRICIAPPPCAFTVASRKRPCEARIFNAGRPCGLHYRTAVQLWIAPSL